MPRPRCPDCRAFCRPAAEGWKCPWCGRVLAADIPPEPEPEPAPPVAEPAPRPTGDAAAEIAVWVALRRALLPAAAGVVLGLAALVAAYVRAGQHGGPHAHAAEVVEFWVVFVRYLPAVFAGAICLVVPIRATRVLAAAGFVTALTSLGFHIASLRVDWAGYVVRSAEAAQVVFFTLFLVVAAQHLSRRPRAARASWPLAVITLLLLTTTTTFEVAALVYRGEDRVREQPPAGARDLERQRARMENDVYCVTCCNPFRIGLFVVQLELLRRFGRQLDYHLARLRRAADGAGPVRGRSFPRAGRSDP